MTSKSSFREGLDQLTPEQFEQVQREVAAAKAARGDDTEHRREVANMTQAEFAQYKSRVVK